MTTPETALGWRGWRVDGDLLWSPHSDTPWPNRHSPLTHRRPQPGWPDEPGIYAWPTITAARFAIAMWPAIGHVTINSPEGMHELTTGRTDQGEVISEVLPEIRGTACTIERLYVDHRVTNPDRIRTRYGIPLHRFTTAEHMLPRLEDFCRAVNTHPTPAVRTEATALLAQIAQTKARTP